MSIRALLGADLRNLVSSILHAGRADRIRGALFAILLVAFVVAAEFLSYRLFDSLTAVGGLEMELIGLLLIVRLLGLIFLIIMALLFFGAMIAAIDALYFHDDIDFLAARPISASSLLAKKLVNIYWTSGWVVYLVLCPVMIGYARAAGASGIGYLGQAFPALFLFSAIPVCLASAVVIGLMKLMPVDKAKEAVLGAGMILSMGLVYLYRYLSPARFFEHETIFTDFTSFVESFTTPTAGWIPSQLMSESLRAAVTGTWAEYLEPTGMLAVAALASLAIYMLGGRMLFETDRPISRNASRAGVLERWLRIRVICRACARRFRPGVRGLLYKELITNVRDPMQLSHMTLIFAIVILHFLNLRELPYDLHPGGRVLVAYLNLGLVGFLTAGIAVRFVYPSISVEGNALWRLQTAPLAPGRFILLKFLVGWLPLLAAGCGVIALSNYFLAIRFSLFWLSILAGASMISVIAALGVYFGTAMPALEKKNVFEISSSPGGIIFMLASLVYVGLTIMLLVRPTMAAVYTPWRFYSPHTFLVTFLLVACGAGLTVHFLRSAMREFENFGERNLAA